MQPVVWRLWVRLRGHIIGTEEVATLVEDDLHLVLDGLGVQQVIEGFTACHPIAVVVRATVCAGHQMFNGSFGFRQWLSAEETLAPLGEQQSVEVSGHGRDL